MANAKKELARADMRQPLIEIVITPPRILEHLLNLGAAEGAQALVCTAQSCEPRDPLRRVLKLQALLRLRDPCDVGP